VSSVLAWLAGRPGTALSDLASILAITAMIWAWWHTRCRVAWCCRPAKHPVSGTTWKVCSNHHTHQHHKHLAALHKTRHPDRLGHTPVTSITTTSSGFGFGLIPTSTATPPARRPQRA
jgi:ABC-type nickel/cobalt efflux system permease component RcnA